MIAWMDVAATTVACVLAVHMGLMDGIQSIIKPKVPIIGCVKCLTFWAVLVVCCTHGATLAEMPIVVATSFIAAWIAIWLDMLCGLIDKGYEKIYEKIYGQDETDKDGAGAADEEHPTDSLS